MAPEERPHESATRFTKQLSGGRLSFDEKGGTRETLAATGRPGLTAIGLSGRSGRSSWMCGGSEGSDITSPSQKVTNWMTARETMEEDWIPKMGIRQRAESGSSTIGNEEPDLRRPKLGRKRRDKHRWDMSHQCLCTDRKKRLQVGNEHRAIGGDGATTAEVQPEIERKRRQKEGTALILLSRAYERIFQQQEELHSLKLEQLELSLRRRIRDEMAPFNVNNGRDGSTNSGSSSSSSSTRLAEPRMEPPSPRLQHQQVSIMMPLPQPNTAGMPHFTGKNISEFLRTWENLCEDYGVSEADRLRKLPRYCDRLIGMYVETIPEFQDKDWEGLKKVLLREYRSEDVDQQMKTLGFLETFKNQKRTEKDDMRQYCQRFAAISKPLVARGELSRYEQVKWFIQGMHDKMAERTVRIAKLNPEDPDSMNFDGAYKASLTQIHSGDAMKTFRNPTKQQETALNDLAKKIELPKADAQDVNWDVSAAAPSVSQAVPDGIVDSLTKSMAALTLPVQTVEAAVAAINNLSATLDKRGIMPGDPAARGAFPAFQGCYWCGDPNHIMPKCSDLNSMIESGRIHRNEEGRFCLGHRRPSATPIFKGRNQTWKQAAESSLARGEQYKDQLAAAKVSHLSVYEMSSDSEQELSEDLGATAGVYAAATEQPRRRGRPPKESKS
jgi:hypothetical protein